jgi:hypothetical protein
LTFFHIKSSPANSSKTSPNAINKFDWDQLNNFEIAPTKIKKIPNVNSDITLFENILIIFKAGLFGTCFYEC